MKMERQRRTRLGGLELPRPDPTPCQETGCSNEGYGAWCLKHTPEEGAGVVICLVCGQPVADHDITGGSCPDEV